MAFKLTKAQITRRDGIVQTLTTAHGAYTDAVGKYEEARSAAHEAYKAALATAFAELQLVADDLTGAVDDARAFSEECAADWRGEFDDRSEKWQESDAAGEAEQFIGTWEEWGSEDLELVEEVEVEDLEPVSPPENPGDTFADLPSAVGEQ